MYSTIDYAQKLMHIEESGIVVMRNISKFPVRNTDFVCPYLSILICERGSSTSLYDMQKVTQRAYEFSCILPGHLIRPIENSEDFNATIIVLSHRINKNLQFHIFSHDFRKFNFSPFCPLDEMQAQRILGIADQLENVSGHTTEELPHREEMIYSLLAVGYEYINFYRRNQDIQMQDSRQIKLLIRFCELVVEHYRESREVNYYAKKLNLTPKYFSKVIRSMTGGTSPSDWIEQYIVAQAKHILRTQHMSIKETAYFLGFSEAASFCRYFKRATGTTPHKYRK